MANKLKTKNKAFRKDIYPTGKYVQYFNPDDRRNPFFKIYKRKREDTLDFINRYGNRSGELNTILDVGGGMGRLSLALAESDKYNVVLTDISIDMLGLAEEKAARLKNLIFVNADAHRLPFASDRFDLIVGLDLFCHLEKPKRALKEFHRILKDKGLLILDSTNSNPLWTLFYPRYLGKNPLNWIRILKFRGVCPGWQIIVKHYPKKKFFSFLSEIGFNVIENIDYGPKLCPKWHLAVSKKNI